LLVQDIRPAIFALRAFNVETALVADQVRSREPTLLQVRSASPALADLLASLPPRPARSYCAGHLPASHFLKGPAASSPPGCCGWGCGLIARLPPCVPPSHRCGSSGGGTASQTCSRGPHQSTQCCTR